jgi:sec-independent protein translocase protein TatA
MSLWHWIIVALVVLILFGRGRISEVMGDFGKGISSFKKGMTEEEKKSSEEPAKQIPPPPAAPADTTTVAAAPERDDSRP